MRRLLQASVGPEGNLKCRNLTTGDRSLSNKLFGFNTLVSGIVTLAARSPAVIYYYALTDFRFENLRFTPYNAAIGGRIGFT